MRKAYLVEYDECVDMYRFPENEEPKAFSSKEAAKAYAKERAAELAERDKWEIERGYIDYVENALGCLFYIGPDHFGYVITEIDFAD